MTDPINVAVAVGVAGCDHLGPFAAMVKVACVSCSGSREVFTESHACARFGGRCIPGYSPPASANWSERPESSLYRLCVGCPENTSRP